MSKNLKMLPIYLMLITGAVTSIITYMLHYEGKTALLILLGVLLFFYIMGSMLAGLINRFEKEQEEAERARIEEEGKVLEKNLSQDGGNADAADRENNVKDAGEQ